MNLGEATRKRIEYYLKINHLKPWEFLKMSEISKSTWYAILNAETQLPQLDSLWYICQGFHITLKEFFDDEIFQDVEPEEKDLFQKNKYI